MRRARARDEAFRDFFVAESDRLRRVGIFLTGDPEALSLMELSPIRRATIVLRFYEDMSEADIARTLDRPLGTVKSDIHRGLAKLRQLLEERAEENA
jgi:hypothetical protein